MRVTRPHAAVWLEIPRRSDLLGTFTCEGDIQVMFGAPDDEVHIVIERPALTRLVEVAQELLAVPASMVSPRDPTATEIRKPAC